MSVSVPSPCIRPVARRRALRFAATCWGWRKWSVLRGAGPRSGPGRIRSLFNQRVSVEDVLDAESFYWQGASLGTVIERATVHGRQRYDRFDASQVVIDWRDA